jgi:predicted DNA-binding transcriptional regulator YafY
LRPGMMLPPLMFTPDEMEAILLGSKWVAQRADIRLGEAAKHALAKIRAVLPPDLAETLDVGGLIVGKGAPIIMGTIDLGLIRQALRKEHKLSIGYGDAAGVITKRIVWPVALGFFDQVRILAAWCELRNDYRHFRIDRMNTANLLDERPPRRRRAMYKEWREREGVEPEVS